MSIDTSGGHPAMDYREHVRTYNGFLKGAVLNAGVIDGKTSFAAAGAPDITLIYVGATIPTPWETVKVGASWDHLQRNNLSDADSFALYTSVSVDKLKINTRVEYFDNGGGAVALGGPAYVPATAVGASSGNGKAEVVAGTLTLDYALWANVITRLEYRYDRDLSHGRNLPGGPGTTGYNSAQLLALNVIYKF